MSSSSMPVGRRSTRSRIIAAAGAALLATGIGLAAATPAHAAGDKTIYGNIKCTAAPVITIGTTATAKGDVSFSLNTYNNTGSLGTVNLGYSSAYAAWGWKWWSSQAGTFNAHAGGSVGAVSAVNRYCQNMFS